ncbi:class II glutamine amidotransferase [Nocardioides sp. zg-1228]|uniref:class II glutamine amidotransferase n=1 Tax=Nocardioides sp. zg-1228 TaxID=2763008 RepID=UPI001642DC43|nr:class II glutamine amidotransferase [Nocardioides sp. zg-1228]MBC2932083.1 class II glutamine amidotransferase [Nocardioides sp. zg-1228]QSF57631.1 class II glutamine amidotransferase [Nocardioides sp. zg-1228]
MCRWLAYSGSPLLLEDLLFRPTNSLVVQSKRSEMGAEAVNGDGFGVGWFGATGTPGRYRSTEPAWNDLNLREVAAEVRSHRFFAHVRATSGTPVQQTNCHPFRHDRWLWMHNGAIASFSRVKRDLTLAVAPDLFPLIAGSSDSEIFFYLALTFGLEDDPPAAVSRAVALIEQTGRRHGVEHPLQMTVATTDGETTWAFRYASDGHARSLFHSTDVDTIKRQHPDHPVLHDLSAGSRIVASEPLGTLVGMWQEVPESTLLVVRDGVEEVRPFRPVGP